MTQHCILSLNVGFLKSQSLGIFFLTYVKRSAMVTDVGNLSISFSFLRVSISSLIFLTLASCLRVEYLVGPSMLYLESFYVWRLPYSFLAGNPIGIVVVAKAGTWPLFSCAPLVCVCPLTAPPSGLPVQPSGHSFRLLYKNTLDFLRSDILLEKMESPVE